MLCCILYYILFLKTKLDIHYSIYKDSLHAFNVELATARQTFFSNLINSNLNNTRTLFATVERLTTPPPPQVRFPVNCSPTANAMSLLPSFLRRSILSGDWHILMLCRGQTDSTAISKEEIDSKVLEEKVQHIKSSTCYLDTLPTSFFKSVVNCLEADLLVVVNTSLLSGTFPKSLKTAVVKPLLKKSNFDHHIEQL